jgi:hypothetical protein
MNPLHFAFAFAAPAQVAAAGGKVRVPALLFTAGEYPDKGVTITEEDLDSVLARFQAGGQKPVPVKAEHLDTPLDPFGEVVALHRDGPNLYGMLVFSEGVYGHITERGVRNLSVALVRDGEGFALKETSLVFQGRVPGAGFLTPAQVAQKVAAFRVAGKITPAMEPHVSKLLSAPSVIAFSDAAGQAATLDVAGTVADLLGALPVVQPRQLTSAVAVPAVPAVPVTFSLAEGRLSDLQRALADRFGVSHDKVAMMVAKEARN